MSLVLPFSFVKTTMVNFRPGARTDFFPLGIGVETYFAQLVSLGVTFLIMGVASLANVLTNISKYFDAHEASAEWQTGHLTPAEGHASARVQSGFALSDVFVSTTLGARTANINVSSSANAEFAGKPGRAPTPG